MSVSQNKLAHWPGLYLENLQWICHSWCKPPSWVFDGCGVQCDVASPVSGRPLECIDAASLSRQSGCANCKLLVKSSSVLEALIDEVDLLQSIRCE